MSQFGGSQITVSQISGPQVASKFGWKSFENEVLAMSFATLKSFVGEDIDTAEDVKLTIDFLSGKALTPVTGSIVTGINNTENFYSLANYDEGQTYGAIRKCLIILLNMKAKFFGITERLSYDTLLRFNDNTRILTKKGKATEWKTTEEYARAHEIEKMAQQEGQTLNQLFEKNPALSQEYKNLLGIKTIAPAATPQAEPAAAQAQPAERGGAAVEGLFDGDIQNLVPGMAELWNEWARKLQLQAATRKEETDKRLQELDIEVEHIQHSTIRLHAELKLNTSIKFRVTDLATLLKQFKETQKTTEQQKQALDKKILEAGVPLDNCEKNIKLAAALRKEHAEIRIELEVLDSTISNQIENLKGEFGRLKDCVTKVVIAMKELDDLTQKAKPIVSRDDIEKYTLLIHKESEELKKEVGKNPDTLRQEKAAHVAHIDNLIQAFKVEPNIGHKLLALFRDKLLLQKAKTDLIAKLNNETNEAQESIQAKIDDITHEIDETKDNYKSSVRELRDLIPASKKQKAEIKEKTEEMKSFQKDANLILIEFFDNRSVKISPDQYEKLAQDIAPYDFNNEEDVFTVGDVLVNLFPH